MQVDNAWYLMTWHKPPYGTRSAITLYGPYISEAHASVDGRRWQQANQDKPC